jgi:hypothetical protein
MKRTVFALLLAILLLLPGCGGKKNDDVEAEAPVTLPPDITTNLPDDTEEDVEPTEEPSAPLYTNGLTGEAIDEPSNLRPYAVMINNIKVALPHCGVSKADIIYEVLVEGTTRMMAIFSDISDAGALGSMRSIRPYFIELARSYDAIVVHAGGSEQAYSYISTKGIDNMDGVRGAYGSSIFYRDPSRMHAGYEHSLFTTGEKVLEYTSILGFREEHTEEDYDYGLRFTEDGAPADGYAAENVVVNFGAYGKTTTFTYDSGAGQYFAAQYGSSYIDGNTGEALSFENVLVLYAETRVLDNAGRLSVNLVGTGNGHFICGGKATDITWSREAEGEKFKYTLSDGSDLLLGVGKTYICIVATGSTITIS